MSVITDNRLRAGALAAVGAAALFIAGCGSSSSSGSTGSAGASSAPSAATGPSTSTTSTGSGTATPASTSGGMKIGTASGPEGTFLVADGRAIYLWVADSHGRSTCYGACAQAWPPVTTKGAPSGSGGVMSAHLGTVTRTDGTKQVTYDGHPLYYFAGDPASGTTHGQGSNSFGAKWWLVAPSGAAITKTSSGGTSTGSSTSSTSSSGSSSGWG